MRALFIHDHPFVRNIETGNLYSSGNLNSSLWERYLKHFDSVTVMGRCHDKKDTSRFLSAERDGVRFNLFSDVIGGADYFKKRKQIERRLIDEIKKHDVIVLRVPSLISMFAADYCLENKIKYVVEVVGCAWDANWNYGGLLPKLLAPYTYFKMKYLVRRAFGVIYVTERFLQNRYPTSAKITSYASNVVIEDIHAEALICRKKKISARSTGSDVHIGMIGNIAVRYKGYDVLLDAIAKLPEEIRKKIKISFVGGGDSTYLESLITQFDLNSQAHVRGKLKSGKQVFDFLDEIDLYIHPSKQEGLPRSVIEAMSRACPVLASSIAGIPELISDDFLHKPGDAKKLSNDIIDLLKNQEKQELAANLNFERSKEYVFSILEKRRFKFFQTIKASL